MRLASQDPVYIGGPRQKAPDCLPNNSTEMDSCAVKKSPYDESSSTKENCATSQNSLNPNKAIVYDVMGASVVDRVIQKIALVVCESRCPNREAKSGYSKGLHFPNLEKTTTAPTYLHAKTAHTCSSQITQCLANWERLRVMQEVLESKAPLVVEVWIVAECYASRPQEQTEAASSRSEQVGNTGGKPLGLGLDQPCCEGVLMEVWTFHKIQHRLESVGTTSIRSTKHIPTNSSTTVTGTGGGSCLSLLQAIQSHLSFSQLASWLVSSKSSRQSGYGAILGPLNIHYRICAGGDVLSPSSKLSERSFDSHSFPLFTSEPTPTSSSTGASSAPISIRTQVHFLKRDIHSTCPEIKCTAHPRKQTIPSQLHVQQEAKADGSITMDNVDSDIRSNLKQRLQSPRSQAAFGKSCSREAVIEERYQSPLSSDLSSSPESVICGIIPENKKNNELIKIKRISPRDGEKCIKASEKYPKVIDRARVPTAAVRRKESIEKTGTQGSSLDPTIDEKYSRKENLNAENNVSATGGGGVRFRCRGASPSPPRTSESNMDPLSVKASADLASLEEPMSASGDLKEEYKRGKKEESSGKDCRRSRSVSNSSLSDGDDYLSETLRFNRSQHKSELPSLEPDVKEEKEDDYESLQSSSKNSSSSSGSASKPDSGRSSRSSGGMGRGKWRDPAILVSTMEDRVVTSVVPDDWDLDVESNLDKVCQQLNRQQITEAWNNNQQGQHKWQLGGGSFGVSDNISRQKGIGGALKGDGDKVNRKLFSLDGGIMADPLSSPLGPGPLLTSLSLPTGATGGVFIDCDSVFDSDSQNPSVTDDDEDTAYYDTLQSNSTKTYFRNSGDTSTKNNSSSYDKGVMSLKDLFARIKSSSPSRSEKRSKDPSRCNVKSAEESPKSSPSERVVDQIWIDEMNKKAQSEANRASKHNMCLDDAGTSTYGAINSGVELDKSANHYQQQYKKENTSDPSKIATTKEKRVKKKKKREQRRDRSDERIDTGSGNGARQQLYSCSGVESVAKSAPQSDIGPLLVCHCHCHFQDVHQPPNASSVSPGGVSLGTSGGGGILADPSVVVMKRAFSYCSSPTVMGVGTGMGFNPNTGLPLSSSPVAFRRMSKSISFHSKDVLINNNAAGIGGKQPNNIADTKGLMPPSLASSNCDSCGCRDSSRASKNIPLSSPLSPPLNTLSRPRSLSSRSCSVSSSISSSSSSQLSLVVNFEESVLNGRMEPLGIIQGFKADIGAAGAKFCPSHISVDFSACYYHLSDDGSPSPYFGYISLQNVGLDENNSSSSRRGRVRGGGGGGGRAGNGISRGHRVPRKGQIQVTLFNPNGSVIKVFIVMYDLEQMPPLHQTFLRQRTFLVPTTQNNSNALENNNNNLNTSSSSNSRRWQGVGSGSNSGPGGVGSGSVLKYLLHLRFQSTSSNKIYLHTDIRCIFSRSQGYDSATNTGSGSGSSIGKGKVDQGLFGNDYELRTFTEVPRDPQFSPSRP